MKIPVVETSGSTRTDALTDMTKLIVTFCKFTNTPKNLKIKS